MRKTVQAKTCYTMGIIGAGFSLMYVLVYLVRVFRGAGDAGYPIINIIGYAFLGAMMLFMTTNHRGKQNIAARMKLLGMFLLLVVGYLGLPPFSQLAGALAVPLFAMVYRRGKNVIAWFALCVFEMLNAAVSLVWMIKSYNAQGAELESLYGLQIAYIACLALAYSMRIIMIVLLYKNTSDDKASEAPDTIHNLK